MGKRHKIDWEGIEKEYRMGQRSVRSIASQFKTSHTTINTRAKAESWVQDKSEEVRLRTQAALLSEKLSKRKLSKKLSTPSKDDLDRAINTNVRVIKGHRKTITNLNNYISGITLKLKNHEEADCEDDLKKDIRFRINSVKELSFAIKNLIPLERQAFNLDATAGDDDAPDSIKVTYYKKS